MSWLAYSSALIVSSKSRKLARSKLIGAPAPWPDAATCQLAARNSFAVLDRSSAERRSFSGSESITTARLSSMPVTGSMSSTSAGIRDSMPSTGIALAIDSSISSAFGIWPISRRARPRIASVSCSSRQAVAQIVRLGSP